MYLFTNIHWQTEGLQCFHSMSFYFSLFLSITYLPRCITMTLKPSHPHLSILFSLSLSLSHTHTCTRTQTLTHALAHTCMLFIPDPHGHNISQRPMHFEKRGNISFVSGASIYPTRLIAAAVMLVRTFQHPATTLNRTAETCFQLALFKLLLKWRRKGFSWFKRPGFASRLKQGFVSSYCAPLKTNVVFIKSDILSRFKVLQLRKTNRKAVSYIWMWFWGFHDQARWWT